MSGSMVRDGVADFARIEGTKYLVVSKKAESGDIVYLCTPNDMLLRSGYRYGFVCGLGFLIVFALLSLYLMRRYTNKMIEEVESRAKENAAEKGSENKTFRPVGRITSMITHLTENATPERKAAVAFEIMLALSFVNMFVNVRSGKASRESLLLDYVLTGKWNKGLNVFSLTSIVLLLCVLILAMMFVRFFMNTLGRMLNSRGKTICRLISNLIIYIGGLVFIYYALSYLGVDTNAILASVGVIGIGVSMGARDLIADIFAGVSMIFEGEYQVGDIVNIDGYRGMVQEVGVRSTRLVGRGGNIKVIGNKDIKSVTNLTKMNSWVAITIKVDVNYAIRDAEEIINRTLPQIAAKHPEIISGPYYKGILSVEMGFAVLSIIAECNEDNYHKVERFLVREILLALRENNVPVR
jgi:small conductance mechanosensitive channel